MKEVHSIMRQTITLTNFFAASAWQLAPHCLQWGWCHFVSLFIPRCGLILMQLYSPTTALVSQVNQHFTFWLSFTLLLVTTPFISAPSCRVTKKLPRIFKKYLFSNFPMTSVRIMYLDHFRSSTTLWNKDFKSLWIWYRYLSQGCTCFSF